MKVFVFPLPKVVLYPKTLKPLNIFEPRYLEMIRESIDTKTPIAIAYADEIDGTYSTKVGEIVEFVRPVAGIGHPQIVEQRADGTLLVIISGMGKVRLGALQSSSSPFLVCEAQQINEDLNLKTEAGPSFLMLQKMLLRWLKDNIPEEVVREQIISSLKTPEEIVGCAAAFILRDADTQQLILETDDITSKVHILSGLLMSDLGA